MVKKVTDMASLKDVVAQVKTAMIYSNQFLGYFAACTNEKFVDKDFPAPGAVQPKANGNIDMTFCLEKIIEAGFTDIADIACLVKHEYAHIYLAHFFARTTGSRAGNIAADLEINQEPYISPTEALRKYGVFYDNPEFVAMQMPKGATAEVYYDLLLKHARKSADKGIGTDGEPGSEGVPGNGKTLDDHETPTAGADGSSDGDALRDVWAEKVAQAVEQGKVAGHVPGAIAERIETIWKRLPDLEGRLRRNVSARLRGRAGKVRLTYNRMNHVNPDGKGKRRQMVPRIVFAFDTSGSMETRFLSSVLGVMGWAVRKFGQVDLIQCDAAVADVQEGIRTAPQALDLKGRGGTAFEPVFEEIERRWNNEVDVLVFCTDLCGSFPKEAPTAYPTIWVTDTNSKPPFGEVVAFE